MSMGSVAAAKQAAADGVTGVVGASWSSHSLAMAPVFQEAGIPMIASMSTNPKVTRQGNYVFRICFIDPFQGRVMAVFARRELKAKTAAIFSDIKSEYSTGLAEFFRENFTKHGGKVLLDLKYRQKQTDFGKQLAKVKLVSPDVIYIAGHNGMVGRALCRAISLQRPDVKLVDTARSSRAGLIVMGAFGRNRINEYFLGSNAAAVVRTSPLPVLLAR